MFAIIAAAVLFLGMGVYGLFAPAALIKPFQMDAGTAEARTEIRAVYGGFGVAVAILLGLAAADVGEIRHGAVIAVAAALLGMAFGRLAARVVEHPAAFYPSWFYFWVELLGGAALLTVA